MAWSGQVCRRACTVQPRAADGPARTRRVGSLSQPPLCSWTLRGPAGAAERGRISRSRLVRVSRSLGPCRLARPVSRPVSSGRCVRWLLRRRRGDGGVSGGARRAAESPGQAAVLSLFQPFQEVSECSANGGERSPLL